MYFQQIRTQVSEQTVVMQCDFAENYSCCVQEETQRHHFEGGNQISIFTCCIWFPDGSKQMAFISDHLQHDIYSSYYCIRMVIDYITNKYSAAEINIFTDGAPSQFKNRYMVRMIADLSAEKGCWINWSFFSTSHGKGVVDAIGGRLKSHVRRLVLARRCDVQCAKDFVDSCRRQTITLHQYHSTDIERIKQRFGEEWKSMTAAVKNIQKIHFFCCFNEDNNCIVKRNSLHTEQQKVKLVKW